MDGSVKDLSAYRLEKAKEDLKTAKAIPHRNIMREILQYSIMGI